MLKKFFAFPSGQSKKGQSMVEYLLVMTVIILVFLYVSRSGGFFSQSMNRVYNMQAADLNAMTETIFSME